METQVLIAFSDELQKIAGVSIDAETRALLADRMGKRLGDDYLVGGEMESNDTAETNFVPKIANAYQFESKTYKKYKKYREPASAVLKGAFPGAFLGNVLGPERMGKNPVRAGALIGAGLGFADWVASGKARRWTDRAARRRRKKRLAKLKLREKSAMIGSGTFTPGRALSQSRSTGRFQDKLIHKGEILKPTKVSDTFQIPKPGE